LPIFCRDVSAYTTRGIGAHGEVNRSIGVGGVQVQPGDLAIGDDDGVYILDASPSGNEKGQLCSCPFFASVGQKPNLSRNP
jgi:regulator of RNase E activity RraA